MLRPTSFQATQARAAVKAATAKTNRRRWRLAGLAALAAKPAVEGNLVAEKALAKPEAKTETSPARTAARRDIMLEIVALLQLLAKKAARKMEHMVVRKRGRKTNLATDAARQATGRKIAAAHATKMDMFFRQSKRSSKESQNKRAVAWFSFARSNRQKVQAVVAQLDLQHKKKFRA